MRRREFIGVAAAWFPFFGLRHEVNMAGVRFRIVEHGHSPHRYLHIHGDETTARQVLRQHIDTHGGKGLFIESETRTVLFRLGQLDPNRMFSNEGAGANLRRLNPQWSEAQVANGILALEHDRHKFVKAIRPPNGGRIVALHNNSRGYSVKDEVSLIDSTSLHDEANPHEFFLCTTHQDFQNLSSGPYNVVLQYSPPHRDDGSLSRLSARLGIRYVNLEVGAGKLEKQQEMLAFLESKLA
jgi:hypothetical protein